MNFISEIYEASWVCAIFSAKFNFFRFIQKSHEFHVMASTKRYLHLFNILNNQMDHTLFLYDMRECSCSILKNSYFYTKSHYDNCTDLG